METEKKMKQIENIALWRNFFHVWKKLNRGAGENLSSLGISFLDYRVLRFLAENGPSSMSGISDFLLVTQGHITGVIDVLESAGMVRRTRSSEDRRVIHIEITEPGLEKGKIARRVHEEYMDHVFGILSQEEKKSFNSSIMKLHRYLDQS